MLKKVLAATTVLAIAGSSVVYAQRFGGPEGPGGQDRGPGMRPGAHFFVPTPDDMSAFTDARIAAFKAGLRLTPDQEKNWPAFESGYRNLVKLRADRMAARQEALKQRRDAPGAMNGDQGGDQSRSGDQNRDQDHIGSMVERMQRRADAMSKSATAFKQFADAAVPLYQSLDDAQKRRFGFLTRFLHPHPMRLARGDDDQGRFEQRGPHRFERGERQRFGGGEEMERMDRDRFAAHPSTDPDLGGLDDEDQPDSL